MPKLKFENLAIKERGLFIKPPTEQEFVRLVRQEIGQARKRALSIQNKKDALKPQPALTRKPYPKRKTSWSRGKLEDRRVRVMAFLLQGMTIQEIAGLESVGYESIKHDIEALRELYNARNTHHLTAKVIAGVDIEWQH